jgi:NAD-dependent DNA ligase
MKEENGPLIALIVLVVLSIVFGVLAWTNYKELVGDDPEGSQSKDTEIRKVARQVEELESRIAEQRLKARVLREAIREQLVAHDLAANEYDMYGMEYERRRKLGEWLGEYEKSAASLSGTISELKNKTMTNITRESTGVREEMEKFLQERTKEREEAIARTREVTDKFKLDVIKYRQQKNYEQSSFDDAKSVLGDLTQREVERATVFTEADGRVLLADIVSNVVVIDIGTSAGVQNGYRFEVYASQPGKGKLVKGYIEVRSAGPSQSSCFVVKRPVALGKDPNSDYVAREPEEMFSPYQESGRKGFTAQPLSGQAKLVMTGMPKDNPIVEGDLVLNPFFKPYTALSFYIAGAKEIVNEMQKSAIRYRWTEIKAVIESYGGKVLPAVDVNVDYVIAQKNPKTEGTDAEKAEFQRAVELGLPVIYEWELFRFLERR